MYGSVLTVCIANIRPWIQPLIQIQKRSEGRREKEGERKASYTERCISFYTDTMFMLLTPSMGTKQTLLEGSRQYWHRFSAFFTSCFLRTEHSFSKLNNSVTLWTGHAPLDLHWQWAMPGSDQHEQRSSLLSPLLSPNYFSGQRKVSDYILKLTGTIEQTPALSLPRVLPTFFLVKELPPSQGWLSPGSPGLCWL